jgi:hypothetical protein
MEGEKDTGLGVVEVKATCLDTEDDVKDSREAWDTASELEGDGQTADE